jgi:hypothetical protein
MASSAGGSNRAQRSSVSGVQNGTLRLASGGVDNADLLPVHAPPPLLAAGQGGSPYLQPAKVGPLSRYSRPPLWRSSAWRCCASSCPSVLQRSGAWLRSAPFPFGFFPLRKAPLRWKPTGSFLVLELTATATRRWTTRA